MRRLRLSWIVNCPRSPSWIIRPEFKFWPVGFQSTCAHSTLPCCHLWSHCSAGFHRGEASTAGSGEPCFIMAPNNHNSKHVTADWPECLSGLWLYSSWVSCALCSMCLDSLGHRDPAIDQLWGEAGDLLGKYKCDKNIFRVTHFGPWQFF